ncbi:MAG: hypothetical protein P4L46_06500 [Fimbriimonas sp.]|nr:hypothetical protein [Fimbriimonas sp.]
MPKANRTRFGFTLIEAIASIGLLTVGIVAVLGALGSVSRTESRARQISVMTSLAQHKYDELVATTLNLNSSQSGDFRDQNNTDYTWSASVDQTGVTNLVCVTVTVNPTADSSNSAPIGRVSGLLYQPPTTSTTTSGTTTGGG